ncbi:hypothetical protein FIE12Z_5133 [Fusarium flagelliforme]|uniref:Uncharacterized protein n=1 Tax=Fusarium flagelliforme TaxID=2675880 RepID=A0A395MTW5_9HYPO|nr:hypothetical protein FIE12Z_5133 [Fusarium flagelliforme]
MAEFAGSITSITYNLITFLIQSGQASDEVRRSLELVRTCDRDLQHLIILREEHIDILERKPIELVRINLIIEDAHKGLLEVARIVEKCRPEAHRGSLPFYRRGGWVLFDSKQFNSQVPVINAHHQSVLGEIGFLRTIALHVPSSAQGQAIGVDTNLVQKRRVDIGGVSLATPFIPPHQPNIVDCPPTPCYSESIPPPLPPKPPSYNDPTFVASSSSKHISIADIQASRGHPAMFHDALWLTPHSPAANFDAIPPDRAEEWWFTEPQPTQYVFASQSPSSRPRTPNPGSISSPLSSPVELATSTSYSFTQSSSELRPPIRSETRLDIPGRKRVNNTAQS